MSAGGRRFREQYQGQRKAELRYSVPSLDRFQNGINQYRVNGLIAARLKIELSKVLPNG